MKRIVSGILLTMLLTSMLTLPFNIQTAKAEPGTIYIRADGSVDPPTAPISTIDNVTYTFTGNIINSSVIVKRNNMVLDGAGYTLDGETLSLEDVSNVTVKRTDITNNDYGIRISSSSYNTISGNHITGSRVLGIWAVYSYNNTFTGNSILNNTDGIYLGASWNNTLASNIIKYDRIGIDLESSSGNTLADNIIDSTEYGIYFFANSYIGPCANNIIVENDISNNTGAIFVGEDVNDNRIYHNDFLDNAQQIVGFPATATNVWDDGYPSGGNYWSDYTDVDLYGGPYQNETGMDGIWDHLYVVDASNQDRYPLVTSWTPLPPWPMFQHDPQHTGRSPYVGPSESPEAEILLGNQTVNESFGTPVISSDGTIYLGSARASENPRLRAFNPDGTQKWSYEMQNSGYVSFLSYWGDPPALLESAGTVYAANYDKLFAIDVENGHLRWEKAVYAYKYLVVGNNGILYFTARHQSLDGSYNTALIGLDQNGDEALFCVVGEDVTKASCPTIGKEGIIYLGYNNTLVAINPNGTEKWRRAFEDADYPSGQPVVDTPSIADDGTIYVSVWVHEYRRRLHAIDPENPMGDKWTYLLHGGDWARNPVIDSDGKVYVTNWYYDPWGDGQSQLLVITPQGDAERTQYFEGSGFPSLLLIDAQETVYVCRMSVYGSATLHIFDSKGNQALVNLPFQEGYRLDPLSLGLDGTLYIGGHKNLYLVKSTVNPPPPPPPPGQPTQPHNIYPEDGAVDVPIGVELVWSPPLENVGIDAIPWEWKDYVGLFTRIERQWQVASVQGDYSHPVINETRSAIIRRSSDLLNENWKEWVGLDNDMTYFWRVRYLDFRGIWSPWSEETSFTTERSIPPEADFTSSNWNPLAGEMVTLDASRSRSGTYSIAHYYWDLNGDEDLETETTSPLIYYRWDQSGTYTLTLKVQSMGGDWNKVEKQIRVKPNPRWERTVEATNKRIFGANGPTEEDVKNSNLIKSELHLEQFDDFYSSSSSTETLIRDMQIQMALKEKIAAEEGEITYEQYIINILHDMELVDSYVNSPWTGKTEVNIVFSHMAKVNVWAELGLKLGGVALKGVLEAALEYGHLSGNVIGVGLVLMIPTILKAGVSLKLLYETLYDYWVWHFFNDPLGDTFDDVLRSYPYTKPEQIDHIFELRDEYAEPLRTRREEFKEEVRAQLRAVLAYVLEKYKALPTMAYYVNSPVELRVYDELGNAAGFINDSLKEEITGSTVADDTVLIYPAIGSYRVLLVGTDEGIYGLDMTIIQDGYVLNFTAINIPICAGAVHLFEIDWAALSQGEKGVTIQVDSNGDGTFEHTFISGSELTRNEFMTVLCDVNCDGEVDVKDIGLAARAFGETPTRPRWNPMADVNQDGTIDLKDIALVAKHFGDHYP